jgi:hypothetical protein
MIFFFIELIDLLIRLEQTMKMQPAGKNLVSPAAVLYYNDLGHSQKQLVQK